MKLKTHNIANRIIASVISFLTLMMNNNCIHAEPVSKEPSGTVQEKLVTEGEVKAFKIGAVFAAIAGLFVVGSYFPIKEVKHALDYRGLRKERYNNFVKSFPNFTVDRKTEVFARQEGYLWDWAACLGRVMQSRKKDINIKQKDIVKELFGKYALFAHNRKETLPENCYYSSGLLESVNKLANDNGMEFVRELSGLGVSPTLKEIKEKITKFYEDNDKKSFVINDSYFYNGSPFVHFVVVSEIDDKDTLTIKDPMVGLVRRQPLEAFCQAYIYDNGHAKLPSIDMFTLRVKK